MIYVVKKYKNRKMYDVQESKYVSLKDVLTLVKDGKDVMVIDNNSKRDITSEILVTALVSAETNRNIPTPVLFGLIRNSDATLEGVVSRLIKTS